MSRISCTVHKTYTFLHTIPNWATREASCDTDDPSRHTTRTILALRTICGPACHRICIRKSKTYEFVTRNIISKYIQLLQFVWHGLVRAQVHSNLQPILLFFLLQSSSRFFFSILSSSISRATDAHRTSPMPLTVISVSLIYLYAIFHGYAMMREYFRKVWTPVGKTHLLSRTATNG